MGSAVFPGIPRSTFPRISHITLPAAQASLKVEKRPERSTFKDFKDSKFSPDLLLHYSFLESHAIPLIYLSAHNSARISISSSQLTIVILDAVTPSSLPDLYRARYSARIINLMPPIFGLKP